LPKRLSFISGAINCQNGPVSGAINCQNGRQILYGLPYSAAYSTQTGHTSLLLSDYNQYSSSSIVQPWYKLHGLARLWKALYPGKVWM
jgi:hypothetical protein